MSDVPRGHAAGPVCIVSRQQNLDEMEPHDGKQVEEKQRGPIFPTNVRMLIWVDSTLFHSYEAVLPPTPPPRSASKDSLCSVGRPEASPIPPVDTLLDPRMQYLAQVSHPRGRHFYQKCPISNSGGTILTKNVLFPIQGAGIKYVLFTNQGAQF